MANHKFDYPDATSPSLSIEFTIAARMEEDADTLRFNDILEQSKGGTDAAEEFGDDQDIYPFSAIVYRDHETLADKASLYAFLATVKRLNTFQWTDDASTVRTVRNVTNPIVFESFGPDYVAVRLELKKQ